MALPRVFDSTDFAARSIPSTSPSDHLSRFGMLNFQDKVFADIYNADEHHPYGSMPLAGYTYSSAIKSPD